MERRHADLDINSCLSMLTLDGNLTLVGAPEAPLQVSAFALLFGRKSLSGSLIGGIKETQEMLDFCGQHNITADVKAIPIQKISAAYDRRVTSDVMLLHRRGITQGLMASQKLTNCGVAAIVSLLRRT